MDWLIEESREGDRALIYFSGHGDVERVTKYNNGQLKDFIIYFHQNSEIINDVNFFYENESHSNFISYYKDMDPRSIKYDTGDFVYSFLKLIRPNGDIIKKINIKINGVLMKDYIKNERIINRYIQYGDDSTPTPYLYL